MCSYLKAHIKQGFQWSILNGWPVEYLNFTDQKLQLYKSNNEWREGNAIEMKAVSNKHLTDRIVDERDKYERLSEQNYFIFSLLSP